MGTSKEEYKAWYRQWLYLQYPALLEDDIYALRCGVFHRGRLNDPRPGLTYDRIVFTLKSTNIEHLDGVLSGALFLSAEGFCRDMIAAANNWYYAKQGEMNVAANLQRLVQYRPHGLKPYVVGVPVVA